MEFLTYLLAFFLPFERIPSFQLHGVTIRITSIILLTFLLVGLPWLANKKRLFPLSSIDMSIVTFYGTVLISILFTTQRQRPILVAAFLTFTIAGYLLVSRTIRNNQNIVVKINRLVIASAALTALFGLFQFYGDWKGLPTDVTGLAPQYTRQIFGFARIQSVGLEPLYYANFLLLPIITLISSMVFSKKKPEKWKMGTFALLMLVFILALSRGAYIAITGSALAILGICLFTREYYYQNLLLVICLAAVSGLLAWGSVKLVSGEKGTENFTSHATVTDAPTASVSPRLENYREAWRLFKTAPVFGIGIGNYGVLNTVNKGYEGYQIVNNQYLETLCETGIVGFTALAFMAYSVLAKLVSNLKNKKDDWLSIALLVTLIGMGIQYNFFSTIYYISLWFIIGIVDGLGQHKNSLGENSI